MPRLARLAVPLALAGGLLCGVVASTALSWSSASSLTVNVSTPAAEFELGTGASKARFVGSPTLSANKTGFSATLRAPAAADATVKDVLRLKSLSSSATTVTLRGAQVTNPRVEAFQWIVRDGATRVAALDYRAASPSATFTLPAGATLAMDIRIDLAEGSGKNNAAPSFTLGVST